MIADVNISGDGGVVAAAQLVGGLPELLLETGGRAVAVLWRVPLPAPASHGLGRHRTARGSGGQGKQGLDAAPRGSGSPGGERPEADPPFSLTGALGSPQIAGSASGRLCSQPRKTPEGTCDGSTWDDQFSPSSYS